MNSPELVVRELGVKHTAVWTVPHALRRGVRFTLVHFVILDSSHKYSRRIITRFESATLAPSQYGSEKTRILVLCITDDLGGSVIKAFPFNEPLTQVQNFVPAELPKLRLVLPLRNSGTSSR